MKKRVFFSHGKILKDVFWCPWCDMRRTGRLIRDLYMWRVRMACGHVRANLGFTMPYEELERKGYINQNIGPDPRYLAKVKQEWLGFFAKRKDAKDRDKAFDLFSSHSVIH
jgi:hypothetical protein